MIKHLVSWDFKDGMSEDEKIINASIIKEKLESLPDKIPEIVSMEVTLDSSVSSMRIVLSSLFNNEADLEAYQENPHHKEVGAYVGRITKDRVCLDLPV